MYFPIGWLFLFPLLVYYRPIERYMPPWGLAAIGAVVSSMSLMATVVSSLSMPRISLTPRATNTASSWYGPGFVTGLLLLAFRSPEYLLLLKLISRLITGRKVLYLEDLHDLKVDISISGAVAYCISAETHLAGQGFLWFWSGADVATLLQQVEAQLAVLHLSSAISVVALTAHWVFLFGYSHQELQAEFARSPEMSKARQTRLDMWTMTFVSSQVLMALLALRFDMKNQRLLQHWGRFAAVVMLGPALLISDVTSTEGSNSMLWKFGIASCAMILPIINLIWDQEVASRFPWPQTSAKWSDWTQILALTASLGVIVADFVGVIGDTQSSGTASLQSSGNVAKQSTPHIVV